jgi:L-fuculose-phosphate aldolase
MYQNGMVNLFEGNISMRLEDRYLISPSQTNKETMTADMILEIDHDGNILNPECGKRPSTEYKMHLQVYDLCPAANACVHNHSVYASAFAAAGQPIISTGLAEVNELFEYIPLVPYGRPGTPEIAAGFAQCMPEFGAVLLENHGLLTVGPTLGLAFALAEAAEKMAKIVYVARMLGGEKSLPEEEQSALREIARKHKAAFLGK